MPRQHADLSGAASRRDCLIVQIGHISCVCSRAGAAWCGFPANTCCAAGFAMQLGCGFNAMVGVRLPQKSIWEI